MNAYPLSWPNGWPRTRSRKSARFTRKERHYGQGGGSWTSSKSLTISDGVQRCLSELDKLGVRDGDAVISTNIQPRLDGLPRSGGGEPADPGVAVYWTRPGDKAPKVMAIDLYDRVADNLAAIAATLEAMRAIERHGGAQILERAFTGFVALPANAKDWRSVLEITPQVSKLSDVEDQYRRLSAKAHPDRGGDHNKMVELNAAIEAARAELGG